MAAVFEKTFFQNLQGNLIIRYCPEIVFSKDNLSNEINVKLYNGESEYSGGGTVSATVIRADGRTVPLTGTLTGNVVSLALIESCMEVPGQIQIFIRLTSGNVKTTVFAGVFTAVRTETDTVIDPGTIIPSVTDLINQIDAAIGSIPADYSMLLGSVAGTYSASKTYAVGDYVWYDGALYRCTTAISTAESWTAAHWTAAVLGDDLSGLKSALSNVEHTIAGDYYKISTGASMQYSVSIPKGAKIIITNNNANYNASAQLKNSNGDVLLDIGVVQSNRSETRTVWVDGVTQITGYCTGGYNATLFVESLDSHEWRIKNNANNISDITDYAAGAKYTLYGQDTVVLNLAIEKWQKCAVKNNGNNTASITLKNQNGDALQSLYVAKNELADFTVTVEGTTAISCYCSSGVDSDIYLIAPYSLKSNIDEINTELENIESDSFIYEPLNTVLFEKGHINGDTGENSTYREDSRARSKKIESFDYDIIISPSESSVECYTVYYYNQDDSFLGATPWLSGNHVINAGEKFRLLLALDKNDASLRTLNTILRFYSVSKLYQSQNRIVWDEGTIDFATGKNLAQNIYNGIRTNMFKVERGTVMIPHIFGVPQIYFYDANRNYIGDAIALGYAHVNTRYQQVNGYMDRANAFEFDNDCYIRISYLFRYGNNGNWKDYFGGIDGFSKTLTFVPPDFTLPPYIRNEVLRQFIKANADGNLHITFATDIHEYTHHHKAHVYCANISSKYLIDGGDLLSIPRTTLLETYQILGRHVYELGGCNVPVLLTKGNHDFMSDYEYTEPMWYDQMQKPFRTENMVYNPLDETGAYFFIDDEEYKIRIICINTFNTYWGGHVIGTPQLKWICETALDLSAKTDQNEWKVFVFGHSHLIGRADVSGDEPTVSAEEEFLSHVFGAANNKTSVTNSYGITANYTNATYTFVAYFCGHVHADVANNDDGYLHAITTCDHPARYVDGYVRTFDSENEYSFDLMSFDFQNSVIKCYRVGVGYDRFFHYRTETNPGTITPTIITGDTVAWESNNTSVATVSNGVVSKVASGYAIITAQDETGAEEFFCTKFT